MTHIMNPRCTDTGGSKLIYNVHCRMMKSGKYTDRLKPILWHFSNVD